MKDSKLTKHPFLVYLIIFSSIFIFGGAIVTGLNTIFSSDNSIEVWQNATHANVTINQSFDITFNSLGLGVSSVNASFVLEVNGSALISELIVCDNGTATIMTRNVTLAQNKGCSV